MPPWTAGDENRRNQDLEDEIAYDLAMEAEDLVGCGLSRSEAAARSRRDFGNVLLIKEDIRERWSSLWLDRLAQDLKYTARVTLRNPAFATTALLTLALGIGIATALFSVIYGLILAPFPYDRPGAILSASLTFRDGREPIPMRLSQYLEIAQMPAFSAAMAESPERELLTSGHRVETVHGTLLSGGAFAFLGARPWLGRTLLPSDIHPDGRVEPVVVLGYHTWMRWFRGDRNVIGKEIVLNGRPRTIAGIMPPRFGWWSDIWMPLPADRYDRPVLVKVRLAPGVAKERAEQQVHSLVAPPQGGLAGAGFDVKLENVAWEKAGRGAQNGMRWLLLVACLLLLISCISVANLQLARGAARSREMALRMSVGAGPARVLRQLFTESMALSFAAGVLGTLLSLALAPAAAALLPELHGRRPDHVRIAIEGPALLFALAASILAGVICGLAPVIQSARLSLADALKDASGAPSKRLGANGPRSILVMAVVAMSVLLLFAAVVTARGYLTEREAGRGFEHVHVLQAEFALSTKLFPGYDGRVLFARSLLDRVRQIPGLQTVAIGSLGGPLSGLSFAERPAERVRRVEVGFVSAAFASTLGVPLRAGRFFTDAEVGRADRVAVINARAAGLLWPGGSAVGRRIRLDILERPQDSLWLFPSDRAAPEVTILGVFADPGRDEELRIAGGPLVLLPFSLVAPARRQLWVRTSGDPTPLWRPLRDAISATGPAQAAGNPWVFDRSLGSEEDVGVARFEMVLFGFAGLSALTLGALGIYSVLSYNVARHAHETGIRMALGATRRVVLGAMVLPAARSAAIGFAAGIAASLVLASQVNTNVPKADFLALAVIAALLFPPTLLACYIPAWRAARLDPSAVLRHE